jgi:hypothetical protein
MHRKILTTRPYFFRNFHSAFTRTEGCSQGIFSKFWLGLTRLNNADTAALFLEKLGLN